MQHSTHYILELQLHNDRKSWYVYAQGISPLFYNLKGIQHFRIYKQWIQNNEFQKKEITWRLLDFQIRWKRWIQFKKRVIRNLRSLESGEVTWGQLIHRK
jgi:hypothetical protein